MTESEFIKTNIDDWNELEQLLDSSRRDPDRLQELFVKVSSDLSYASSYYPNRSVRLYLNKLTQRVFDTIETKSKGRFDWDKIKYFFSRVVPMEMYHSRKAFLLSFIVFTAALLIGVVSTLHSEDFARLILGDAYINMTEDNINNGDPMAVYKDAEYSDMFFGITVNNIRVSFLTFVMGIFAGFGTFYILVSNGIMVGAFQTFFYKKGLLATSFFTIWIHGTIEISAIIIAGAAGFVLGSGLLFPGTYGRGVAMQISAKRSVRIIVGIVPLFIIAGFLESFVTRLTDLPLVVKVAIILMSLSLIIGLYVLYPWWVYKTYGEDYEYDIYPQKTSSSVDTSDKKRVFGDIIDHAFTMYRIEGGRYMSYLFKLIVPVISILFFLWIKYFGADMANQYDWFILFGSKNVGPAFYGLYLLSTAFVIVVCIMLYHQHGTNEYPLGVYMKKLFFKTLLLVAIPLAALYFFEWFWVLVVFIFLPPQYIVMYLYEDIREGKTTYSQSFSLWPSVAVILFVIGLLHYLLLLAIGYGLGQLLYTYLSWHDIFSVPNGTYVFINSLFSVVVNFMMLPAYIFTVLYAYKSYLATSQATDLRKGLETFGESSSIFES